MTKKRKKKGTNRLNTYNTKFKFFLFFQASFLRSDLRFKKLNEFDKIGGF